MINVRRSISSILREADSQPNDADRALYLRDNDSDPLRILLKVVFDEKIIFDLPEGNPPYRPNNMPDAESILYREVPKLYYYIKDVYKPTNLNGWHQKKVGMFIDLLERLDPEDAELMLAIKSKKLPYKNISMNVVLKAFPDIGISGTAAPERVRLKPGPKPKVQS